MPKLYNSAKSGQRQFGYKKRNRWSLLIYFVYLIILLAGAAEILARLIYPQYTDDQYFSKELFIKVSGSPLYFEDDFITRDAQFGVKMKPNFTKTKITSEFNFSFTTNDLGFRKNSAPVDQKSKKILLLGDSMMFGWGINDGETISDQLSQGLSINASNYCIPGTNIKHAETISMNHLHPCEFDHVVYGLFLGNDLFPNAYFEVSKEGYCRLSGSKIEKTFQLIKKQYSLLWHSVFFRVISLRGYHIWLRYHLSTHPEILNSTMESLGHLKEVSENNDAKFTVLLIPPAQSVNSSLFDQVMGTRKLRSLLLKKSEANQIGIIDLHPVLVSKSKVKNCYFPKDKHLNPDGVKCISDFIEENIFTEYH